MILKPKLDILPVEQRKLWSFLKEIPDYFVLYGGTAIALRYGHRQSVDFDFFTSKQGIDLEKAGTSLNFMQSFPYLVTTRTSHQTDFLLQVDEIGVKITFLNNQDIIPGSINSPDKVTENKLNIASPLDLMGCKILALHHRIEAKDFVDVAELIKNGISLQKGFEAAYAIAKLSRLSTKQLMLDRLQEDLKAKTVETIIAESEVPYIAKLASESALILKEAAQAVNLEKVYRTKLKANKSIERQSAYDIGR